MTTERGKRLRKFAEEMAKLPNGTVRTYETLASTRGLPDGTEMYAVKDGDGGQRAGLDYSLEAVGARKARGEDVEEDTRLLIQRAKDLKLNDPEATVRLTINSWERNTRDKDKR